MAGIKIALCGGIRSGKDTVAEQLVANHGFRRFAFGDGIRELCREFFPEQMAAGKPRALLQGVGQDLRKYDPDVWIKWILSEISYSADCPVSGDPDQNVVISDLRQPNEYAALRSAGFYIVRVNASEEIRIQRARAAGDVFDPVMFAHETESHYHAFEPDFEIRNEGSFAEFAVQIQALAEHLLVRGGRS